MKNKKLIPKFSPFLQTSLPTNLWVCLFFIFLSACAPKVQHSDKKRPDVPELQTNDIALQQAYINPYASINFTLKKIGLKKSLTQNSITNLFEISDHLLDSTAYRKALDLFNQLQIENLKNTTTITKEFKDTNYLQLVEEQTRKPLQESILLMTTQLLTDTDQIEDLITTSSNKSENKSKPENNLKQHLLIAQSLTSDILLNIQQANLFPELKNQVLDQIKSETTKYISMASEFETQKEILSELTPQINLINLYVQKLGLTLGPDSTQALRYGQQLGAFIDRISNAENSLQALALTWRMLSAEDRIKYFIPASRKLYDLFYEKDAEHIQCLIEANCTGFIPKLILKLGVYPELNNYGIQKIKAALNTATIGYLGRKIDILAFEQLNGLPLLMKKQIRTNVEKKLADIENFRLNFKNHLAEGLNLHFKSVPLNMYILSNNPMGTEPQNKIQLQDQLPLAINQLHLLSSNPTPIELKTHQISLIEKTLSLIDFSNDKKVLLENGFSEFLKNPKELFLMPEIESSTHSLFVKDQAATLKFLTLMMTATADWKPGPFDHGISDILVQDVISDFKSDELKQSLFPKVSLFNICFAYAAQVLKQIQSEKSLVYLIDNSNQRLPISDYLSGLNHPTVALGAASDKIDNVISNITKISDLADLIESLSLFSEATKDIQNSQSAILKNPDFKNQLASVNKNIQLLVLTLANFISSQMVSEQNLVGDTYDFESQKLNKNFILSNQVAAISALVKAYEITGIEIYLLSAKELYYSLNKNYFDPQLKFYKNNLLLKPDASTSQTLTADVLNTLNQLIPLRKYLVLPSQVQFDRIFENWYVAILL